MATHTAQPSQAVPRLIAEREGELLRLTAEGDWTAMHAQTLDRLLEELSLGDARRVCFDGARLTQLDSTGIWLMVRAKRRLAQEGTSVEGPLLPEGYAPLLHKIDDEFREPPTPRPRRKTPLDMLVQTGRSTVEFLQQGYRVLGYLGRVTIETAEAFILPTDNLRFPALVNQVQETGLNALPIVGLLSFLIGIVIAYQGVDQLRRFGAEIFTINLLGIGILRELGVLITAIVVAGRSGSAFTAHIGTMKVNEELDAMNTIGLNSVDMLVLPRILGLVIALPLLTFYSDLMAMIGGAVMCYFDLGITFPVFMRQLHTAVTLNTFLVGIIKAPVFAFVIGLIGCFEGMQVERNAASVGKLTTRSVVESIFAVIVLDAGFSVLFSVLKI